MRSLAAWVLVLAWAGVIFTLSSIPSLAVTEGLVDLLLRKAAHMTEYALLTILLIRALGQSGVARPVPWAAGLAVAYAISDEFHQSFVPGRAGLPRDVLIDAVGIAIACALAVRLARRPMPRPA